MEKHLKDYDMKELLDELKQVEQEQKILAAMLYQRRIKRTMLVAVAIVIVAIVILLLIDRL